MYVHIGIKLWYQKKDDWLMHVGLHKGTHICSQIWEECTADVGSQMDINMCTDSCTHASHGVGPEEMRPKTHMQSQTDVHLFSCNYAKWVHHTWIVSWTCIHVVNTVDH